MRPVCPICKSEHFAREPHVFKGEVKPLHEVLRVASNKVANASNAASNRSDDASNANRPNEDGGREVGRGVEREIQEAAVLGAKQVHGTKQRWAKDKYNAYQREYMKVVRAVKAGRAFLIRRKDGELDSGGDKEARSVA